MGLELDLELNAKSRAKEIILSTPNSRAKIVIIPTDEEFMIASDTLEIVRGL
jgi:acetate kinase